MKALSAFVAALVPIIMLLNFAGGVVGGIWAAVSGDWWAIGYALVTVVAAHFVISILLLPSMALGAFGAGTMERGRIVAARIALAASTLYLAMLMGLWAIFVTAAFLRHEREAPLFPIMLLGYGAAMGPWAFLATKDQQAGGNEFSVMSVFWLQAGYVVGGTLFLLNPDSANNFIVPVGVALTVNWLILQTIAGDMIRRESVRQ